MSTNNNIKGISVEIGADSSKLSESLKKITNDCGKLQKELSNVNKALKFDPSNAVLAAQKQEILTESIEKTAQRLELLKQKQESMNKALNSGKISGQEYREFQREIEATRSKLTYYSSELEKAKQNTEALSESSADAKGNIKGLGNELNSASKEAEELSDANKNAKESLKSLGKEAEKTGTQLSETSDKNKENSLNLKELLNKGGDTALKAVTALTGAVVACTEATREYRQDMARLEQNNDQAGGSFNKTKEALQELNKVSQETDSNVEGLSNLLKAGFTDSQLLQTVNELSGAVIQFPDTLKIESLSDSLQETMATGAATGQFGELLERLGINLKDFNKELVNSVEAGEEQEFILETLANTGLSEVTDKYLETNKALADSADAQFRLNDAMAEVGSAAEPILSQLKGSIAEMVQSNLPQIERLIQTVGGALVNLMNFLADNGEKVGKLISDIITSFVIFKGVASFSDAIKEGKAFISTIKSLKTVTDLATVAQGALNLASAAFPALAIAGALAMIVSSVINLNARTEEYKKNVENLKGKYDDTIKEVKELETELEETNDRMAEIKAKGTLTLVEQQEMEKLKETNADLKEQLEIKKTLALLEGNELSDAAIKYMDKVDSQKYQNDIDLFIDEYTRYKEALNDEERQSRKTAAKSGKAYTYDYYLAYGEKLAKIYETLAEQQESILVPEEYERSEALQKEIAEVLKEEKMLNEAEEKLSNASDKNKDKDKKQSQTRFEEEQKALKLKYDLNEKTEAEYYSDLEKLLEEHNVQMTDETEKYYINIAQYKKKQEDKALSEQKAAAEKMAAEQKQLNEKSKQESEKAAKEAADSWEKEFEAVSNEAIKAFDKISDKRESLEDKLADSVTVSVEEDDEYKLTDLEAETEKLKEYQRLREELLASTNEEFVTETFDSMSVDEAGKYASTLLSNRDGLQQYLADWQEQQAVISEISMNTYKNEADNVKDYFFNVIGEKLSEMPDIAAIAGKETAEKYADSACEALRQKMAEINASMMDIYYNPKLNPNFRYNGTSDYEYGRVTSQTPKVIKETVHMPVGDIVIQVDGQNLVTRTLNELRDQVLIHGRYSDLF